MLQIKKVLEREREKEIHEEKRRKGKSNKTNEILIL